LDSITAPELAIMLRRGALRIDTASFLSGEQTGIRADILAAVDKLSAVNNLTREVMVAAILRDWLTGHGVTIEDDAKREDRAWQDSPTN
jgi:DNA recombination-dependent growth factor C